MQSTASAPANQEVPLLRLELFEEIAKSLEEIQTLQKEEAEAQRKAAKLEEYIEQAKAAIAKAEEKKAHLAKRNELLKGNLEDMNQRTGRALEYWRDYGFAVEQAPDAPNNTYRYIYTKLAAPERYVAELRFEPEKEEVRITSQEPEVLSSNELAELNERLSKNCLHEDGATDYKLAMLMIRKQIITKAKTASRQQ